MKTEALNILLTSLSIMVLIISMVVFDRRIDKIEGKITKMEIDEIKAQENRARILTSLNNTLKKAISVQQEIQDFRQKELNEQNN